MPVQVIGMIGVAPPADDATVHIIDGGLSADYLVEFSRAHDEAGFDLRSSATPQPRLMVGRSLPMQLRTRNALVI